MDRLPVWYIGKLNLDTCDTLRKDLESLPTEDAVMGIDANKSNPDNRSTKISFAPSGHWFEQSMYKFGLYCNQNGQWNYDLNTFERIQYTEYNVSQHYDWHMDTFLFVPSEKSPTDRKVSVVCLLNDTSEFEGGEFQLRFEGVEHTLPLVKGDIVAFPSLLYHRVTPVKSGVRQTAVMWISGPKFK